LKNYYSTRTKEKWRFNLQILPANEKFLSNYKTKNNTQSEIFLSHFLVCSAAKNGGSTSIVEVEPPKGQIRKVLEGKREGSRGDHPLRDQTSQKILAGGF
jgi:hypothetical protein